MKASELPLRGLGDARLATHAASHLAAWLWTLDGARMLWANPVGVQVFGARRWHELQTKSFGAADPHRRQIAQLASRLRADESVRLERLRGFGAPLGRLATCACSRLQLADGSSAVLVVAMESAGRTMALRDRLKHLVEDADMPLAAFDAEGIFVGANDAARALLGFRDLSEAGLQTVRDDALRSGRAEAPVGRGHLVLQRVGSGANIGLIALLDPAAPAMPATPAHAEGPQPHPNEDERSEFLFVDEFDDETELESVPTLNMPDPGTEASPDEGGMRSQDDPAPVRDLPPEDLLPPRTEPLRFLWEIDAAGHFRINSNELPHLIGEHAAASLDAPWKDVASAYASYGRMAAAIASEAAWSGVPLSLPTDNWDEPLTADLSGIPSYRDGAFAGYRGFGVIHDLTALSRLATARQREAQGIAPRSLSAHIPSSPVDDLFDTPPQFSAELPLESHAADDIDPPVNVVPLRPTAEGWSPALTPGENNAFNELARELSARLEAERMAVPAPAARAADPDSAQHAADGASARALLDLAPLPMAVHRGNRLLYANAAFVAARGFPSLTALQSLPFDAASVEGATSTSLDWDGERARALVAAPKSEATSSLALEHAEDFGAILDAASEAILMFDAQGAIRAGNRSAARLFAIHGDALLAADIASLFTADTQVGIAPLLERLRERGGEQMMEARSVVGGRELPLRVAFGRARPDSAHFYAIVRDLTAQKTSEAELAQARRQTERTASDKADILARISHEMRSPLSAIIGFADVMIEQRFGPLGNDRYADYLRDIRGCGERVVAIIDDLLDLSRIESGKRDLAPSPQDLNELVEQCVAAMQPQANRERIIIRSSLAHPLPRIFADGAALRQITLNLIGNSIHLANPGGQVIVSTVRADAGDVLLRVRDTGHGLNDNEVANALSPFRPSDEDTTPAQIRLSLTRALAEACQARFSVKPAPYAGTLIEVAFSPEQSQ